MLFLEALLNELNLLMYGFIPQSCVRMGLHVGIEVVSAGEGLEADRTGQDFILSSVQTLLIYYAILLDLQNTGYRQLFVAQSENTILGHRKDGGATLTFLLAVSSVFSPSSSWLSLRLAAE